MRSSATGDNDFERLDAAARLAVTEGLEAYYGIEAGAFADHAFWRRRSSGSLWVAHRDVVVLSSGQPQAVGLRVRRGGKPTPQVSTPFLRRFGAAATRHVITLDADELVVFFAGTPQPTDEPGGYYVVRSLGSVIGRGLVHSGMLHSELGRHEHRAIVL